MSDLLSPDRSIGVFETILIIEGSPVELEAHLDRLQRSASDLFGEGLATDVRMLVRDGAAALSLGRLRLTVAPGHDGALTAEVATASVDPDDVFPTWERAADLFELVVDGGLGAHKWADRSGLEQAEATPSHAGLLALLLDADGEVLEASRANVFAVEDGVLVTPAADGRILPGIARAGAIEAARSLGLEVREESLALDRLIAARQAFLTGSVRGIEPVSSVGEVELDRPGEIVGELANELRRCWIGTGAARSMQAQ